MTQQQSVATDRGHGFVKALGTVDALFIGFGAMIGFGWVVLTGEWLSGAGTLGAILAFAVGGVIMCFVGTVYSELVAAMPHAGSARAAREIQQRAARAVQLAARAAGPRRRATEADVPALVARPYPDADRPTVRLSEAHGAW